MVTKTISGSTLTVYPLLTFICVFKATGLLTISHKPSSLIAVKLSKPTVLRGTRRIISRSFTLLLIILKEQGHDVGQVTFHSTKMIKFITVDRRNNEIVNRLNKTKEVKRTDWLEDKNARIQAEKKQRKEFFENVVSFKKKLKLELMF